MQGGIKNYVFLIGILKSYTGKQMVPFSVTLSDLFYVISRSSHFS